jgi:hypothetical protein
MPIALAPHDYLTLFAPSRKAYSVFLEFLEGFSPDQNNSRSTGGNRWRMG